MFLNSSKARTGRQKKRRTPPQIHEPPSTFPEPPPIPHLPLPPDPPRRRRSCLPRIPPHRRCCLPRAPPPPRLLLCTAATTYSGATPPHSCLRTPRNARRLLVSAISCFTGAAVD
ncbi:hypothetical protein VPH35_021282 [Triticum aestivum]